MLKKLFFIFLNILIIGICSSCSHSDSNTDEEYRTVPVTNNPLIVPDSGSSFPGFPASSATPR